MPKIVPCLWMDDRIEEAVRFYVPVFGDARIINEEKYDDAVPGQKGKVMTMSFELEGQEFMALNGGPIFKFNEAVSFVVNCKTQAEVDYFWEKLTADGGAESQCAWLKDKYGLSWQIVPEALPRYLVDADPAKANRVMQAMLKMKKIDIAALDRAYAG